MMAETPVKNYNKKDVDFSNPLNNVIYDVTNKELIIISGGCKRSKLYYDNHNIERVITSDDDTKKPERNPIGVNEYFLKRDKKWSPKLETVNGIFCKEAFLGHVDISECSGCEFYGEKDKAPIYEYKGEVPKKIRRRKG